MRCSLAPVASSDGVLLSIFQTYRKGLLMLVKALRKNLHPKHSCKSPFIIIVSISKKVLCNVSTSRSLPFHLSCPASPTSFLIYIFSWMYHCHLKYGTCMIELLLLSRLLFGYIQTIIFWPNKLRYE